MFPALISNSSLSVLGVLGVLAVHFGFSRVRGRDTIEL